MKRWLVCAVLLVGVAALVQSYRGESGASASTGGQPSGLTPHGVQVWNTDALVNDTFGRRRPCWNLRTYNVFSVLQARFCPSPLALYNDYVFTFLNAFHSHFVLRRARPYLGNATPIRINNRYVYCGGGKWLVFGHGAFNADIYCA